MYNRPEYLCTIQEALQKENQLTMTLLKASLRIQPDNRPILSEKATSIT